MLRKHRSLADWVEAEPEDCAACSLPYRDHEDRTERCPDAVNEHDTYLDPEQVEEESKMKKTKKKAAQAKTAPKRFLVVLDVTVQPGEDDPGLWDWEALAESPVRVESSYPLALKPREED